MLKLILAAGLGLACLFGTTASAQTRSCTDPELLDNAVRVANKITSPLFGQIEVLDTPFNMRPNRAFQTSGAQCVADVVTNRAHMLMYYGWETIHDNTYVTVKLVPNRDAATRPALDDPPDVSNARWDDVLPQVKRNCAREWRDDYHMQAVCIRIQHEGWTTLHDDDRPVPDQGPALEVGRNYVITALNETPPPNPDGQPQAYTEGRAARIAYENWFASLDAISDYRAGATYWAGHRSLKPAPTTCPSVSSAYDAGCAEAQRQLTPSDMRRKAEPEFKRGWNSL